EDGIRDLIVTGVQTCALPIYRVDLAEWGLKIEGNVNKPLTLSFSELTEKFKPVSVTAVNQCSGNSRSRFQPRVAGGQWGNGAMEIGRASCRERGTVREAASRR